MNQAVKSITDLTSLNIPVPPMLAKAIGYKGKARFVSFQWTPYGDETDYSDGRVQATGNWQAFLAFIHHPAVSPTCMGMTWAQAIVGQNTSSFLIRSNRRYMSH